MKQSIGLLLAAGALSALLPLIAQERSPKHQQPQPANKQVESRGQRVFNENCARCHDAPQSFPPQVSGTILRHMRVRASLSARDEKALIEFLNP